MPRTMPKPSVLSPAPGFLVLRVMGGPRDGQVIRLKSAKCTVGSSANCTLRLRADCVDPVHCLVLRGQSARSSAAGRPTRGSTAGRSANRCFRRATGSASGASIWKWSTRTAGNAGRSPLAKQKSLEEQLAATEARLRSLDEQQAECDTRQAGLAVRQAEWNARQAEMAKNLENREQKLQRLGPSRNIAQAFRYPTAGVRSKTKRVERPSGGRSGTVGRPAGGTSGGPASDGIA